MKKHPIKQNPEEQKSILATVRSAFIHLAVFGVISISGHVATSALSSSIGIVGGSLVPPVGSMLLI